MAVRSIVHIDEDLTLAQARHADAMIEAGTAGPLTGIPIAHKDVFVTQGWRSTAGSRMLRDYVSPYDATVVARLQAAGAVSLGKLNCDEFAMGSGNEHSVHGPARNPWDLSAVPGGSSGGSAAAVAARLVMASMGTDTGGSVRQPAALCGVSGIKPTYGTVSRYGMIAYGSSLDQAGPFAAAAVDLVDMLDTISGFDPRDSTSAEHCNGEVNAPGRISRDFAAFGQQFARSSGLPLQGLRIGVPREYFGAGLSPQVGDAIEAALAQFEALGATRVDISLPNTRLAIPAYYVIAPAEASSNLARYDGVRYGLRVPGRDITDMYEKTRAEGFGAEVRRRVMIGTYVLSAGYYDAYYLRAQQVRTLIKRDFEQCFAAGVHAMLTPATPSAAFGIGEKGGADPVEMYLNDVFTVTVNMAGLPGLAVPAGLSAEGLPLGLQLIGRPFDEETLFSLGEVIEQAAGRTKLPTRWWA